MKDSVKQKISYRFSMVANVGQDNMTISPDRLSINTFSSSSTTQAEISTVGSSLKVNPSVFPKGEVETRIETYIHEAAHLGQPANVHHKPKYWDTYSDIFNTIYNSEKYRSLIQSVFTEEIDWEKLQYRAVQAVNESIVDARIESVFGRQAELAESIGYGKETLEKFEICRYSWQSGDPNTMFYDDEYTLSIPQSELSSSATEYTQEEFITFIEKYGNRKDQSHVWFESPITYMNGDRRKFIDREYAHMAIAFADRIGMDYIVLTDASAVIDGVYVGEVSDTTYQLCKRHNE